MPNAFAMAKQLALGVALSRYQDVITPPTQHCRVGQVCFPPLSQISAFNHSIQGRLFEARPVAEVCYAGSRFDADACDQVHAAYQDEDWRRQSSSAAQFLNHETLSSGLGCPLPERGTVGPAGACHQGTVPAYVVESRETADVEEAVKWAGRNRLTLRIRNTAHDYLGRSSGQDSVSIVTAKMNSASFLPSFSACDSSQATQAIRAGAGMTSAELTAFADEHDVDVIATSCGSVGVAGGVVMGGGHGPLSRLWGMASDNVLQFEIVTADGVTRIASPCTNPDLFWALRGGGGGTFGVVTNVWFKAHAKLRGASGVFGTLTADSRESYSALMRTLLALTLDLDSAGIAGYAQTSYPTISIAFLQPWVDQSPDEVRTLVVFKPLYDLIAAHPGLSIQLQTDSSRSWNEFYSGTFSRAMGSLESVGINFLMGGRLVPRASVEDNATRDEIADTLSALQGPARIQLVAGGAVSREPAWDSALNPAWRTALLQVNVLATWSPLVSAPSAAATYAADLTSTRDYITRATQQLAVASKSDDAYFNEANVDEEDWTYAFWGSHYPRLAGIKRKWDPQGLFSCWKCVGQVV